MHHKMSLFMATLMIVMALLLAMNSSVDSGILFDNQGIENQTSKQFSPLSQLISKQTIPLLQEAAITSAEISTSLSLPLAFYPRYYMKPETSISGEITRDQKEMLQLKEEKEEASVIVSETSINRSKDLKELSFQYWDGKLWHQWWNLCDDSRIIGICPGEISNLTDKVHIASKGYVKIESSPGEAVGICEQKSIKLGENALNIPKATLKSGLYNAFNGPDSAIMLDEKGGLISVLVGKGDKCDLYVPTEAEVTGILIQNREVVEFSDGGKINFSEVSLKARSQQEHFFCGHVDGIAVISDTSSKNNVYKAFNGLDCAFILSNNGIEVIAILIKEGDGFKLYLACTAEVTGAAPDFPLKPGTYKAFNSSNHAVVIDEIGNPIDIFLTPRWDVNSDGL